MQQPQDKDEEKETQSKTGFQRHIRTRGKAEVDPLFEERLQKNKEEIAKFYLKHPDLKEKPYED